MRGKLFDSSMLPEAPLSAGIVHNAGDQSGIAYLKNRVGNTTPTSAQREHAEARAADISEELIEQMVDYIDEAHSQVSSHELGATFQCDSMRANMEMAKAARRGEITRLGRGGFVSNDFWDSLSPDEQFQLNNQ